MLWLYKGTTPIPKGRLNTGWLRIHGGPFGVKMEGWDCRWIAIVKRGALFAFWRRIEELVASIDCNVFIFVVIGWWLLVDLKGCLVLIKTD